MPSRAHSSAVRRTLATPRRCPSIRGSPCCCAQRPLPSMMMAMCRGRFVGRNRQLARRRGRSSFAHGINSVIVADSRHDRIVCSRSGPTETTSTGRPTMSADPVEVRPGLGRQVVQPPDAR